MRSTHENDLIKENIISITSARKNKISVVQTIAVPKQSNYVKSDALNLVPEIGSLFREIIETLDNNGEELLADNILFRSNKLGIKSKNFVQEQRYLMSNKIINKYMWITGGVILVNPLPAVDFLTTTSVNLQMIMELSKIYEIKLTKNDAKDLSKSLLSTLAKLGEEREKETIIQASNSDLILFVLDQDINKYENYLIKELIKLRKKIIIVLNKCDLRSRDENNLIKENIINITSARKNKI